MNDPGIQGQKLSKSGDNNLDARNKSYNKLLDAETAWIQAERAGLSDAEELRIRWQKKAEWHEKEFGF